MQELNVKLPASTIEQKVFKTKVVFLGISKTDKQYNKQKSWTVNDNRYMVEDGQIAFLPEEAYNSLNDAVSLKASYKTKKQMQEGLDMGDPEDVMMKTEDRRYDLTILGEYVQSVHDGKKVLVGEDEDSPEKKAEARRIAKEEMKAEVRAELEAEKAEEIEKELKELEEIPDATPDEDIETLMENAVKKNAVKKNKED